MEYLQCFTKSGIKIAMRHTNEWKRELNTSSLHDLIVKSFHQVIKKEKKNSKDSTDLFSCCPLFKKTRQPLDTPYFW